MKCSNSCAAGFVTFISVLALAACTPPEPDPVAMPFGEAVRTNIIAQAVHPEGPPPLAEEPGFNGDRALLMQRRYQVDKVEKPSDLSTSTVIFSSGGDGGD